MNMNEGSSRDRLVEILGKTLEYVANEVIVLSRLEEFFSPEPARLTPSDAEAEAPQRRVDCVIELLSGPPKSETQSGNSVHHDVYPLSAISEVINMFHRILKSVARTHMFMIGVQLQKRWPGIINLSDENDRELFMKGPNPHFGSTRKRHLFV
jgi:hypothetical protein